MSNSRELIEESINGIITLAKKLLLMNSSKKSRLSCGLIATAKKSPHLMRPHLMRPLFILARREDMHACLDCKVIPGECVVSQHKLVVADFRFRIRFQRSKCIQVPRTKWWKLKEETVKMFKERVLKEDPWHEGGDTNSIWMGMTTCIRKVASEEFGVTKGGKCEAKET
jgi:hypothetical protein